MGCDFNQAARYRHDRQFQNEMDMIQAFAFGDFDRIKQSLKSGTDCKLTRTSEIYTYNLLLLAASNVQVDAMVLLAKFDNNLDYNQTDGFGHTALDIASESGIGNAEKTIEYLRSKGAKTSKELGITTFQEKMESGEKLTVSDLRRRDYLGRTGIVHLAMSKQLSVVVEAFIADETEKLEVHDLFDEDIFQTDVLTVLVLQDQLSDIFDLRLWKNRRNEFEKIWQSLDDHQKKGADFEKIVGGINQETFKDHSRPIKLRRRDK